MTRWSMARRRHGISLWILIGVVSLIVAHSVVAGELELVKANPESLARALEGVETELPRPGVGTWLEDVTKRILDAMVSLLERLDPRLAKLTSWGGWRVVIVVVAVSVLAYLLVVASGWNRRRSGGRAPEVVRRLEPLAVDESSVDRRWGEELEQALGAGQVMPALEALWWWLAERLLGDRADKSWTSRELLVNARRCARS